MTHSKSMVVVDLQFPVDQSEVASIMNNCIKHQEILTFNLHTTIKTCFSQMQIKLPAGLIT